MFKRTNFNKKIGGGYAPYSVSHGARLWLSLILSFLCATLLCCAFLLFNFGSNASAAVKPNQAPNAISYSGTAVAAKLFSNNKVSIPYSELNNSYDNTVTASSVNGKVTLSKANTQAQVTAYASIIASIEVPALTTYTINFSYTGSVSRQSAATYKHRFQLLYYGNTADDPTAQDQSSNMTFVSETGGSTYCSNGQNYVIEDFTLSTTVTQSVSGTIPSIVVSNTTSSAINFCAYFGVMGSMEYNPTSGAEYFTDTLTMSAKLTVTSTNAPTVDRTQADYSASGNVFNFTYDNTYVDYTVSFKDVANRVSDVTSTCTINSDGKCTLKEAGTYTFTFKIKDISGAVWNSTTNDQTDKILTITIGYKTVSAPSGTVETTYNGEEQSLSTLTNPPSWYDANFYDDKTIISMDDALTDAGDKEITVTMISGGYYWSDYAGNPTKTRTFTFSVKKKELSVTFEDNGGAIVAKYDEAQLFDHDNADGKTPVLITKYSKTGTLEDAVDSPTSLGNWYAIAVLENDCNYYVNAMQPFSASKKPVAYPVLSTSSNASEQYNGSLQIFTFEGFDSELMDFTVPDGATFDGTELTAINAGTYTIVYTLKDTDLYQWTGSTALSVTVEKKNVVITSDEGNPAEWSKGDSAQELKFRVTGLVSGDSVKLSATYSKNGVGSSAIAVTDNGDGTQSVSIPKTYGTGNYVLTVRVADGENYAERDVAVHSFTITAEGLDLGENEIKWKINGVNHTVDEYVDGFIEIEYTGSPLTLSVDISASESAPELEIDGFGGDYATAVERGEYTATVHIVASNPAMYSFDETYTLNIKIVAKVLTFENAEWQWQYEGDEEWKQLTDGNMPAFDNKAVAVRLSPDYLTRLGLAEGDYTLSYRNSNDMTEKGDKTTAVEITITNVNYTTGNGSYTEITKQWKITAKALAYSWTAIQPITAGDNTFEFPAIEFEDGNDYSQYFEYIFTIDGDDETEYTKEQLEEYLLEHWSDTSTVIGRVYVRMLEGQDEVVILSEYRNFSTGTPKTALAVTVSGNSAEYGKVDFSFAVKRGATDESARTTVTISGDSLEEDKVFDGNDAELLTFVNGLSAGSYKITVNVTEANEGSYTLTGDYAVTLEIAKCKVELPTLKEGVTYNGDIIYFKDCIDGFDGEIMKIIGAEDNGIDFGTEWRENGYFTKIALLDADNYEFAETQGSEYEYNWYINKFLITEEMWNKDGIEGAVLELPSWVKALLENSQTLNLTYGYFTDMYSDALEEYTFTPGSSFYVNATLSGTASGNFEFENGTSENGAQISAKTVYTVPKAGGSAAFFEDVGQFVKNNLAIVLGVGFGLLFLIVLIILLARRRRYAGYDDDYDDEYDYDDEDDEDDDDYDDDYD